MAGIVSNPPYIPSELIFNLQPEVVDHEPHLALDGGQDGLAAVRHLAATAPRFCIGGGLWLVELMMGQAEEVSQFLQATSAYGAITIHPDLAGVERFISAQSTEANPAKLLNGEALIDNP